MITVRLFYTNGEVTFDPKDVVSAKYGDGKETSCYVELNSGDCFIVDKAHFLMLYKNTNNEINQDK